MHENALRCVKLWAILALSVALTGCIGDYMKGAPLGGPSACANVPAGTTVIVDTPTYSSTVVCK